jgi:hypothetical protein
MEQKATSAMIPDIGNGAPSPLLAAARRLVPFVAAQAAANEAGGKRGKTLLK